MAEPKPNTPKHDNEYGINGNLKYERQFNATSGLLAAVELPAEQRIKNARTQFEALNQPIALDVRDMPPLREAYIDAFLARGLPNPLPTAPTAAAPGNPAARITPVAAR